MKHLLVIVLLFVFQINVAQEDSTRGYKVKVGEQAPDLNFTLLDGTQHTNQSLKGKVVVLQFTASWCVVCRKEMPHLEKEVWQKFKNEDFILIGIDLKEDLKKVERFIAQMKVTYPFTIDEDGAMFESFTLPKAGVTRNIVLDKNGKIIFLSRLYDEKEFAEMIAIIDTELKK
ncbi:MULTISPECIES: TlpA family protein disulfide reductase [Flavobacteriaceae]|uniref:TlpA family protein disulfide reductase n=2 Tax=Flavobacteriaceae TaxID=49546 RepID=A0A4Y8ARU4_9FLAO|nr:MULTISPECIES: TlpA disulfide reductase family protein [Flavobacteriaceae]TEW73920.1 TlpA family protein disulfide reductase [Gramella jeungdoensis]GGK38765.1 protein disulfide-isomerase [Lutibacter litoralis]